MEMHRHLHPARTLLIDLGDRGRGDCSVESYVQHQHRDMEIYQCDWGGGLPTRAIEWLCSEGVDTIYSCETLYDPRILPMARANGIRVVVHAMPELAPWATTAPHQLSQSAPRPELAIPTGWRSETLPGARLLPVPVARDRLPFKQRTSVSHLHHVTGAAMLDRAGTAILLAALPHVTRDCYLTIRTEKPLQLPAARHVDVTVIDDRATNYWESYPDDVDVLVLPRRYGGLSLPTQECASLGVPTIALASDPYARAHGGFVTGVTATKSRDAAMKGGVVPVWDASPLALAAAIDQAIADPESHARQSLAADRWADAHSWDGPLLGEWCEYLEADCARDEAAA